MAGRLRQDFPVGSLVRVRGRDWVVLSDADPDLLMLRPLGGTDEEVTAVYLPIEPVKPASFPQPDASDLGDFRSAKLLRDALRLGFRDTTAPLRSIAHIAFEPRPYQLVPLLMALRLDPVRLLIADDVGVGKTIESALIARELLDRGEVDRLAILCPPHLAEQWQCELAEKFNIDAELVLPGTASRLERGLGMNESVFDRYPYVVVSTDFIKSDRRWQEFVRACPELVIVDEAHECADQSGGRSSHQRYRLVSEIARHPSRHLILVTATPHSGNESAFRNLLGFLDSRLGQLPEDLSPEARRAERTLLANHFVQRRRSDVLRYLDTSTTFPQRESVDRTYKLSLEYRQFFYDVLRWCRERVRQSGGGEHRQRVRWWAALGLLRAIGSSPAAAAATLYERALPEATASAAEADDLGRRTIMDLTDETAEGTDVTPGAEVESDEPQLGSSERRRLRELALRAQQLMGPADRKLEAGIAAVRELVNLGRSPIVFCKFIETAEYVAAALRNELRDVTVEAVTGRLPHDERERRVSALAEHPKRILVATDCLSEGINLQEHFNAVVHYDLAWNPTRHEQREGRVDRFGQPREKVVTVMLYGDDNPVDGIVLDVLLRKHRAIRESLGVSVPVPESQSVLEAILEGLLLRGRPDEEILGQLELFERDVVAPRRIEFHREWDRAVEQERKSRSLFAQEGIRAEEVAAELEATRQALGGPLDIRWFAENALVSLGGVVTPIDEDGLSASLAHGPRALLDQLIPERQPGAHSHQAHTFRFPFLRTHPNIQALASFVLDNALDPQAPPALRIARRGGVIRTRGVERRSTLLLLRLRYNFVTRRGNDARLQVGEESALFAFAGSPDQPELLGPAEAERLLSLEPAANVTPDQARYHLQRIIDGLSALKDALAAFAHERAKAIYRSHERVAAGAKIRSLNLSIEPCLPPDVLGVYVYLPVGQQ